jgi:hypothetical protein
MPNYAVEFHSPSLDRQSTLEKAVNKLETAKKEGRVVKPKRMPNSELIPMRVSVQDDSKTEKTAIKVQTVTGRGAWLFGIKHMLGKTSAFDGAWAEPNNGSNHGLMTAGKMMAKQKKLSPKYQSWIDARTRFHLSDMHIQMARELGMNPKKFGKLANHKQEPWKEPLPDFIESLYRKRFKKDRPEDARSIERMVKEKE